MKQLPLLSHQLPEKLWTTHGEDTAEELKCSGSDVHYREENREKEQGCSSGGQVDRSTHLVRAGSPDSNRSSDLFCCIGHQRHSSDHRWCVWEVRGRHCAPHAMSFKFLFCMVSAVHTGRRALHTVVQRLLTSDCWRVKQHVHSKILIKQKNLL